MSERGVSESWLFATTGAIDAATAVSERRLLHVTVLITPRLAQVGLTTALVGELPLHRGALAFGDERLADGLVSRSQGALTATPGGGATLVDHESRHGTWLNGARLAPGVPTPVGDGDRIHVGRTLLLVQALPLDPDGWERDAAIRRASGQRKDRESRRAEELAVAEAQRHLARAALVGTTMPLREARRELLAAARLDGPVLVTGPTGSGKEAAVATLHAASLRRRGPFVAFSCAEVAPNLVVAELFGAVKGAYTGADRDRAGLWRSAARGTLFLDEVGDAPPELQAALLRAIESGTIRPVGGGEPIEVDVRLVAATKRDLDAEVGSGRFRDDLLFRLAGTHVRLPPLAERPADAVMVFAAGLARHGLEEAVVGRDVVEAIWHRPWPGNGRELMHLAERAVADASPGGEITLPRSTRADRRGAPPPSPAGEASTPDRAALEALLMRHDGNVTHVARELGVRRQQVYRWVERHGIALGAARGEG